MIGALVRTFLKGIFALVVLVVIVVGYRLYQSGQFPRIEEAIEDTTVAGSVKAALALHRELGHRPIHVEADRGRVLLSGAVSSDREKEEAGELARSVDGVRQVDNRLEIERGLASAAVDDRSLGEKLDDVALLAKVRAALRLDRDTRPLDLDVSVRAGTVTLKGTVPDTETRKRVVDRVTSVGGVEKVEDDLGLDPGVHGQAESESGASRSPSDPKRF